MSLKTTVRPVMIIDDLEIIKSLADPIRREILRQLAEFPMTEAQLAVKLKFAKSSIGHHLQTLINAGLIRVERTEVESHGIQQKYYESTSKLFLENFENVPPELQRYFLHIHMERLRGILSVIQLMEEEQGRNIEITREQLEGLSLEIAKQISIVGKQYEEKKLDINRETLLVKIYCETLRKIAAEHKWPPLKALEEL